MLRRFSAQWPKSLATTSISEHAMPIEWPKSLISDLLRRQAVVVLGAGVSKNSLARNGARRPPLWTEFLEAGVARVGRQRTQHIKKAIRDGDLLHACEWLKRRMDDDWIEFLRDQFVTPQYQKSELHDKLFRLDQRVTLSLNIDNIYETFVLAQTDGKTVSKRFYDEDVHNFLRDYADYIIKIHASIDAPNNIIFSQEDYARARTKYASFYHVLDACILSHTLLFVGCGVADPDVNLLLENQNFKFPQSQPHYMITSSKVNRDMEESLRKNRNVKCIKYDPRDSHVELLELVEDIAQTVEAQRSSPGSLDA